MEWGVQRNCTLYQIQSETQTRTIRLAKCIHQLPCDILSFTLQYSGLYSVIIFYQNASCLDKNQTLLRKFLPPSSICEHSGSFKIISYWCLVPNWRNMRDAQAGLQRSFNLTYDLSLWKHLACRHLFVTNCTGDSPGTKDRNRKSKISWSWFCFNQ